MAFLHVFRVYVCCLLVMSLSTMNVWIILTLGFGSGVGYLLIRPLIFYLLHKHHRTNNGTNNTKWTIISTEPLSSTPKSFSVPRLTMSRDLMDALREKRISKSLFSWVEQLDPPTCLCSGTSRVTWARTWSQTTGSASRIGTGPWRCWTLGTWAGILQTAPPSPSPCMCPLCDISVISASCMCLKCDISMKVSEMWYQLPRFSRERTRITIMCILCDIYTNECVRSFIMCLISCITICSTLLFTVFVDYELNPAFSSS